MKTSIHHRPLIQLLALIAGVPLLPTAGAEEVTLGIGDKAPELDIEHSMHDNGFGKVGDFEEGKVYVVEFWATWCGPCIQSMPHLAKLQTTYRDKGVQIISVSAEKLETVQAFLKKDHIKGKESYAELTSAYSLTVDPDKSVHTDYMKASGRNAIPAAFLIGKTGLIEWIGHPNGLDEPLKKVVADEWDRENHKRNLAAKQENKIGPAEKKRKAELDLAWGKIDELTYNRKSKEAIALIDQTLEEMEDAINERPPYVREMLMERRYLSRLHLGDQSDEVLAFFRKNLKEAEGSPHKAFKACGQLMMYQMRDTDIGPLAQESIDLLNKSVQGGKGKQDVGLYIYIARFSSHSGQLDEAVAAMEMAYKSAEGDRKDRLKVTLEEFKKMAAEASKKEIE